jgi:hypothetical protein
MNSHATMLKIAYLKGLEKAAEETKEAGLGTWLAKGVGKMLYRPAAYAAAAPGAAAKGLRGMLGLAPKGEMLAGARGLIPGVGRFAKNMLGFGTTPVMSAAGKAVPHTGMSRAFKALTLGGRQVPATMLQYGTFGGLMGGLMGGQPGEGFSWSGAGKGFLGGAASGLGWAAGGRMARGALGKALGSKAIAPGGRLAGFAERGKRVWGLGGKQPGFWAQRVGQKAPGQTFKQLWKTPSGPAGQSVAAGFGQSIKDIGTKAALGVPLAAGVLGTSIAAESAAGKLMGEPGMSTSPQALAARGTYMMTPSGRRVFYG